jgi:hypothetical protein
MISKTSTHFFSLGYSARAMNEIRRLKGNTITKAVTADLKKEMEVKNTGLAAANNFLIERGDAFSAVVTTRGSTPCLATIWQRVGIEARVTSAARRFPTPLQRRNSSKMKTEEAFMTTHHLFWPDQRRRPVAFATDFATEFKNLFGGNYTEGAGGSAEHMRQEASTEKLARNFMANGSPAPLLKKTSRATGSSAHYKDVTAFGPRNLGWSLP